MKNNAGKKILMICYYFPPLADVGCKRSVAFTRHWRSNGWKPHVLSVKNPDKDWCNIGNEQPPEGVEVTYARSLFNVYKLFGKLNGLIARVLGIFGIKVQHNYLYDIFCIPDIFIGWVPLATIVGFKIIKKENIDVIYVTCSPFSAGVIGWLLKKITKKPLIIDYRDTFGVDISKYQENIKPTIYTIILKQPRFREIIDNRIARLVLKSCDLFTVTTREMNATYLEHFPFLDNKIHTIYNGFDHYLLQNISTQEKYSKFTITYAGNFYYEVEYEYFFEALGILKTKGIVDADSFQFLFYGGSQSRLNDLLNRFNIKDLVHNKNRISQLEVFNVIKCSHLQLLRIIKPMISTKLFEGIALNVPFLATIPDGEVESIIKKYSPSSFVVNDNCPETVADAIQKAITQYHDGCIEHNLVEEFLQHFTREKQALKYIDLIPKTVDK